MKLFKSPYGFIISFGFDIHTRKEDPSVICWNDPSTESWGLSASSMAGTWHNQHIRIDPEFVFVRDDGAIVAYQPGLAIEMKPVGHPYIFEIKMLLPDEVKAPSRAA